jgi:NADH:ubiquinone oxidoreductase subunit F (NADH-binding)/NADH:ubiquinone oxidoreductase subunit E
MQLIRLLSQTQEQEGYLSEATLRELSRVHRVPLHRLQQIISFYPHFRTTPPPRVELSVCRDMACYLAGSRDCVQKLRTSCGGEVEIHEVSCLGRCDTPPAMAINGCPISGANLDSIRAAIINPESVPHERTNPPRKWKCDPYSKPQERYSTLKKCFESTPENVIETLKQSGLRGMGGAGFPTGTKWELVRKENRFPKFVICNADESEPGTFKDREILADLPHLVIEGMLLAGWVVGAERGILYLRHEYHLEQLRFEEALKQAYESGILGRTHSNGFRFDLEVFVSPGGYILGEETALLEALEDKRGEPRNKPPFPGTHGLNGQPTLINNVETLCMTTSILAHGVDWWKAQGKPSFAGLKFIAVSGHVERPGVYEIATGTTVRELIELAGGVKDGKPLLAVAPGGASSNFLPASAIDVPLDFGALAKAGSMLGSGAVFVVAEGTDLLELGTNIVSFFRNESCGKCVPCRVGSQKAVDLLEGVIAGDRPRIELNLLTDLSETMTMTSICGLGQVAVNPVLSILKHWPELAK